MPGTMTLFIKHGSGVGHRLSHCLMQRHLHGPRMLQEVSEDGARKRQTREDTQDVKIPRFVDRCAAEEVAQIIKPRLKQKPIFECCPGQGLLTHALLETGVGSLVLWEPQSRYWDNLEELSSAHEEVELQKRSFFRVKGPNADGSTYLQKKKHAWNSGIQLQVVGGIHPKDISMWMARSAFAMATGNFPYHRGRAKFFFVVGGREHQLMVDPDGAVGGMVGPVPRRVIDYQLYYNISTLLKIPKYTLDGDIEVGRIPKTASWDRDHFYLVEMTPRADLFNTVCERDHFSSFITFNQQLFRVRKTSLVQRLERWSPGLGLVAIDLGYTMTDTVKQLQAQHLPLVFKELQAKGGLQSFSEGISHEDVLVEGTTNTEKEQKSAADGIPTKDASPKHTHKVDIGQKKAHKKSKDTPNETDGAFNDNEIDVKPKRQRRNSQSKATAESGRKATKKAAWYETEELPRLTPEISPVDVKKEKHLADKSSDSVSSSVGQLDKDSSSVHSTEGLAKVLNIVESRTFEIYQDESNKKSDILRDPEEVPSMSNVYGESSISPPELKTSESNISEHKVNDLSAAETSDKLVGHTEQLKTGPLGTDMQLESPLAKDVNGNVNNDTSHQYKSEQIGEESDIHKEIYNMEKHSVVSDGYQSTESHRQTAGPEIEVDETKNKNETVEKKSWWKKLFSM